MARAQTVLLTGASGYIAKHIALKLLNAGYDVVGSVRALSRGDEVRAAVTPHLDDPRNIEQRLRFVALDLADDKGWPEAMHGVDILMHTASPFPLEQPENEDELIRPAVDGALRALRAARDAGIKRVVMTSSAVAVMDSDLPTGKAVYDEEDWTDPGHPGVSPYAKSKTMAERAAWDFIADQAPDIALTTINPVLVVGPPLDRHFGTSVSIIQRLLAAKDPMLPRFGLAVVDVRDIAEMHVRALQRPETKGHRLLGVDRFMWFVDVAKVLKSEFPDRKIVTRQAPNFLVRILAIFDKSIRQIVPILGVRKDISNARARELLGTDFIPAADSLTETATFLIENDLVNS